MTNDKREELINQIAKEAAGRVGQPAQRGFAAYDAARHAALAVFEKAHTPTGEFRFTDDEWRAYQSMPDQGYSHRDFIEGIVNSRRTVQGEPSDAVQDTEEVEWEYGNEQLMNSHVEVFPASSEAVAKAQAWLYPMRRRRKAGPWEAVPAAENNEREEQG